MEKTSQLKNLICENRDILLNGQAHNGICYDGIVDEDSYNKESIKLLVLMKETNGNDKKSKNSNSHDDWDYIDWIKKQQSEGIPINGEAANPFYTYTFRKLCLWLTEFFDIVEKGTCRFEEYFTDDGKIDITRVRSSLKKAAIINLKKSWGNESTDARELYNYAVKPDISLILNRQMKIISPDIVLCCSPVVFEIARKVYGDGNEPFLIKSSITIPNKKMRLMFIGKTIFVEFYHPAWYGKSDYQLAAYADEVFSWVLQSYKKEQSDSH